MKPLILILSLALSLSIVPGGGLAQQPPPSAQQPVPTARQSVPPGAAAQQADDYPPGPDSVAQPGVPKGEVLKFSFDQSRIFPGTYRDYWIYVPAQYKADIPACLYVNQDGIQWQAPIVFDNLIYKKEMPVTIGVFVMHGRVRAPSADAALDRFNRSYEYDGLGDNYVRFLLEELLPDVETRKTSDGRPIKLSRKAADRAIGGSSSGAICAFTAAWERPDSFSRVFSAIGTYVGLRGGDHYPALIRRLEPKPIRVFLQDGSSDLNIYGGDWWMANQTMERALIFAGYEVQHVWGTGSHSGKHGTALFPDAMRWLWKDWPQPVKIGVSANATLKDILIPGESWRLVGEGYKDAGAMAISKTGEVLFAEWQNRKLHKIDIDGNVGPFPPNEMASLKTSVAELTPTTGDSNGGSGRGFAMALGPGPGLYALGSDGIVVYDISQSSHPFVTGFHGEDLVIAHSGNIYVTNPDARTSESRIWLIKPDGQKRVVDIGPGILTGVTLSPDQTLLYAADSASRWVHSYQLQQDGALQYKQRYYWLEVSDATGASGAGAMWVDADGRLYVATPAGIQVCDQAGRVNCILPVPTGRVTSVCFGGENFDRLYVACGDKVYVRKLKVRGSPAWAPPHKPAAPRL
jgi:enterochelin esterase-like enzyme